MTTVSRSDYVPLQERLRDVIGKPAASIRYSRVTGKWGVNVFHENGIEIYQAFHHIQEATEFVREELCDDD